ncbi:MAG: hypothetical protein ACOX1W_09465 [Catenisphaera adipataccumulans]|jgi:hypothetical protein|uniref:hypothetical protein n=1 Tax=Catenisphaera adipataccumulans TaxID=700500 RepID=UPI003D93C6C6
MKYFVREIRQGHEADKNAGSKARNDVCDILSKDFQEILVTPKQHHAEDSGAIQKLKLHKIISKCWSDQLMNLRNGDSIVIQFPCLEHSLFLSNVLKEVQKRGVYILLLIHDLELLRINKTNTISRQQKIRIYLEETKILKLADAIICHNDDMKQFLIRLNIPEDKLVSLRIFDYLIPNFDEKKINIHTMSDPIIIAGNLAKEKSGYVYQLPSNVTFNLYGVGYKDKKSKNVVYKGSFLPDDLPFELEGSFGLVWDGPEARTCTGAYGEYLRVNNPHKTSLYLASGLPVIIWKEAAMAKFIKNHHCGICVNSLDEIHDAIKGLSSEDYVYLKTEAEKVGEKLRDGYYLNAAIHSCMQKLDK